MEVHAPWSFGLAERRIITETSFSPQKHKDLTEKKLTALFVVFFYLL